MEFNLSEIKMSNKDKHFGVMIPNKLSIKLAELIGIMVGDGHVGIYQRPKKYHHRYDINITGNIKDESHMDFVNKLFFDIFNVKLHKDIIKNRNCIVLRKQSRAICQFFANVIGIPNNKSEVPIPNCILTSTKSIKAAFLRGLADTDFCLTTRYKPNLYPVIHGTSKSQLLIEQCSVIFQEFGIENHCCRETRYHKKWKQAHTTHRVYINGFKRVGKYMELVGFSNKNKALKYEEIIQNRNHSTIRHTPKKFL